MGWLNREDGPYDFADEIREARAADEHLYTPEEARYGLGAPTRREAEADEADQSDRFWKR